MPVAPRMQLETETAGSDIDLVVPQQCWGIQAFLFNQSKVNEMLEIAIDIDSPGAGGGNDLLDIAGKRFCRNCP